LESQKKRISKPREAFHNSKLNANKYKILSDHCLCGFLSLSADCRILEVNQSAADLLGCDAKKEIGKSLFDFILPNKNSPFFNDIKSVISHSGDEIRKEYEFITSNGSHIWLDVSIRNQLDHPLINAVLLNLFDITPFMLRVENLKGEKERYDILAKATSDTIWHWDIVNDKMQYNSGITEMFGYSLSEIENTENWWQKKIHPDDLKKVRTKVNKVLIKEHNQMQIKYRFLCHDGSYKYIYDRAFLIFDSNHKPIRMIGAMQDVTQFRNYILSIKRQNLKLKKIAWTQSHVVRAPLARIMGLIDLLKANPSEDILELLSTASKELDDVLRDIVKVTE
jgi:PAS domain S-box-containing protein